jgi:hypothetical protein
VLIFISYYVYLSTGAVFRLICMLAMKKEKGNRGNVLVFTLRKDCWIFLSIFQFMIEKALLSSTYSFYKYVLKIMITSRLFLKIMLPTNGHSKINLAPSVRLDFNYSVCLE